MQDMVLLKYSPKQQPWKRGALSPAGLALPFGSAVAASGAGLCRGDGERSPQPRSLSPGVRSSRRHLRPRPKRGHAPSPAPRLPGRRGPGVTAPAPWCVYFGKADGALGGWRRRQCQFLYSLQPRIQIKSLQACLELLKMPFRMCHLYCLTSAPLHHG